MHEPRPFQFSISHVLWGTALAAVWSFVFSASRNHRPPELTDPNIELLGLGTVPILGGFIGLFCNKTKGMLIGIAGTCYSLQELKTRMAERFGRVPVQFTLFVNPPEAKPATPLPGLPSLEELEA